MILPLTTNSSRVPPWLVDLIFVRYNCFLLIGKGFLLTSMYMVYWSGANYGMLTISEPKAEPTS